jgi:hypothetical protein
MDIHKKWLENADDWVLVNMTIRLQILIQEGKFLG